MLGILVGEVTAYRQKSGLATVRLQGRLFPGDYAHIVGPTTDCEVRIPEADAASRMGDAGGLQDVDVPLPLVQRRDAVFRLIGIPQVAA